MNALADVERYIERLLKSASPEAPLWNVERACSGAAPHWNYIDSCMLLAFFRLFDQTGEARFLNAARTLAQGYVTENGTLLGYDVKTFNLDNLCGGRALLRLFESTRETRYDRAAALLYGQLEAQPKTKGGSFWHKRIYPQQVWLDGLYMALPFAVAYRRDKGLNVGYGDVLLQFENARKTMYDAQSGLYRHGYDSQGRMFWANEKGLSGSFWLRSIGWFSAALVDVYELLPQEEALGRARLASLLKELMEGLLPYMEQSAHMFYQVVDQGRRAGNYLETSGSAMIAYAMLKGARLGVLDASFCDVGLRVFDGIRARYFKEKCGEMRLSGICLVAGLGPEGNPRRDGSFSYYISEPVVEDDAKGIAPFLMCYAERLSV